MRSVLLAIAISTTAIMAACSNVEIGNSKDVSDSAVYADYKIWGEEDKGVVNILLQYRMGGDDGTTLVLENPAEVRFDGERLKVDSAGFSGAYYEVSVPLSDAAGKHTIVYKSVHGKEHIQEFVFSPFSLKQEWPQQLPMQPTTIQLSGLPKGLDQIRLVMTDTAFNTNDVNELVLVRDSAFSITQAMWDKLHPGPVVVELYTEEEKSISNFSVEGGLFRISYGLKREFEAVRSKDTARKRVP